MKLSIIIPIYNSEKYIYRTIENIENQTLSKEVYEVIFVDDQSTDNTFNAIKNVLPNKKNFYIYKLLEKKGAGGARNFGISVSEGEYILFLDADDTFEENFLEKMLEAIDEKQLDIAICNFKINGKDQSLDKFKNNKVDKLLQPIAPWNKIFKASFVKNTGIFYQDNLRHQDLGTISKWLFLTDNINYIDSALYNYHKFNEGSITKSAHGFNMDIYHILDDLYDFFKDKDITKFEKIMNLHLVGRYEMYAQYNFKDAVQYTKILNNYIIEKTKDSNTFSFKNTGNIKHEIMHKMSRYTNGVFPVLVFKTIKWVKR